MNFLKKIPSLILTFLFLLNTHNHVYGQVIDIPDNCVFPNISIDPDNTSFEDLSFLDSLISDARVVFLGDLEHGEANVDSIRIRIIKYLHNKLGFNAIAFESGIYDLYRAQLKIEKGAFVPEALSEGILPVWSNYNSFQILMKYLESTYDNWKIVGFDCQFSGDAGEDIGENLEIFLTINQVEYDKDILEEWNYIAAELSYDELPTDFNAKRFNKIESHLFNRIKKINKKKPGELEPEIWLQIIKSVGRLAYFNDYLRNIKSWVAKDFNKRDSAMADNLLFWLKKYPDRKFICWGASAHFALNTQYLENDELNQFTPMGSLVKNELGEKVFSIGVTGYTGKIGWEWKKKDLPESPENSIEYAMYKKGYKNAFIYLNPIESESFNSLPFVEQYVYGQWGKVFDALIYFKEFFPKTNFSSSVHKADSSNEITIEISDSGNYLMDRRDIFEYKILKGEFEYKIHGTITDSDYNQPVPFTSVGLLNSLYGTSSDSAGYFEINLPSIEYIDTLVISHVAFERIKIPLSLINPANDITVKLKPKVEVLPEIIISSNISSVDAIIRKAIERIQENYIYDPFTRMFFYSTKRLDTVKNIPYLLEWTGKQYYKKGYAFESQYGSKNWFKSINARIGIVDEDNNSVSQFKRAGLNWQHYGGFSLHDYVKYRKYNFLSKKRLKYYTFQLSGVINMNEEYIYKIDFICNKPSFRTALQYASSKFYGSVYINSKDYAIMKIETLAIMNKDRMSDEIKKYGEDYTYIIKKVISYKKMINEKYALTNVQYYDNFFLNEFADIFYYDYEIGEKDMQPSSVYVDQVQLYDPQYWKNVHEKVDNTQ